MNRSSQPIAGIASEAAWNVIQVQVIEAETNTTPANARTILRTEFMLGPLQGGIDASTEFAVGWRCKRAYRERCSRPTSRS